MSLANAMPWVGLVVAGLAIWGLVKPEKASIAALVGLLVLGVVHLVGGFVK